MLQQFMFLMRKQRKANDFVFSLSDLALYSFSFLFMNTLTNQRPTKFLVGRAVTTPNNKNNSIKQFLFDQQPKSRPTPGEITPTRKAKS